MSLEILNTLILSLLVVVAVLSLWVRDLVVSAVIFGVYSFFNVPVMGRNGGCRCCLYRSDGGCWRPVLSF